MLSIVSLYGFLFRLFGLTNDSSRRIQRTTQVIALLMDALASVCAVIYCYCMLLLLPWKLQALTIVHFSFIPFSLALHLWRIRAGQTRVEDPRKPSWIFLMTTAALVSTNLIMIVIAITYALIAETLEIEIFGTVSLDVYVSAARCIFPVIQLQGLVVNLDIALTMIAFSEEIQHETETLSRESAARICARTAAKCHELSRVHRFPLILTHISNFVRLSSEMPLQWGFVGCREDTVYLLLTDLTHLLEYLIVISSTNSVANRCRALARKIRHVKVHSKGFIEEVRPFTMVEHGINIADTTLNWKFSCYFLSLCWGFTLTAFQSYFAKIDAAKDCKW